MATVLRGVDYVSSFFSSSSSSSITSSFSSRPFLRRLLSPGGSSSTSAASPPPELGFETPPPQPQLTAVAAMDIESGEPSSPPPPAVAVAVAGRGEEASDAKRVAKLVQPVALAAAAGSLVLFVNAPPRTEPGLVYAAYVALVCLGLFTSLGLSMHAVVRSGDPAGVAALHKRLLLLAIAFVLGAAVLRFSLVVPGAVPLHYVLPFLVLGALASLLFLHLAGRIAQAT